MSSRPGCGRESRAASSRWRTSSNHGRRSGSAGSRSTAPASSGVRGPESVPRTRTVRSTWWQGEKLCRRCTVPLTEHRDELVRRPRGRSRPRRRPCRHPARRRTPAVASQIAHQELGGLAGDPRRTAPNRSAARDARTTESSNALSSSIFSKCGTCQRAIDTVSGESAAQLVVDPAAGHPLERQVTAPSAAADRRSVRSAGAETPRPSPAGTWVRPRKPPLHQVELAVQRCPAIRVEFVAVEQLPAGRSAGQADLRQRGT